MARRAILAIDEGTTNSKAVLVSQSGEIIASAASPVPIEHPQSGWVQQDATEIWRATQEAIASCVEKAPDTDIAALGISNQRESILIWDRSTGAPLGPVITWQCRRTADACEALKAAGHESSVIARTGLPLDPLFPPTKIAWLLKNLEDPSNKNPSNEICIGTIDSWLIWKLSDGIIHATDRSNAARTQLFNLAESKWDQSLCDLFGVDQSMLPEVYDSSHVFGETRDVGCIQDGIPIASAIGDSHAALFGHGAFGLGDGKVTFGTGSSVMATIPKFELPPQGITTTIAWSIMGQTTFAFEGNILTSASIFPWTADILGLADVDELMALAARVENANGVCLVPAHVGLGSPHWNSYARGLISGLSFGTEPAHIARAATDSMALQVLDVLEIMSDAAKTAGRLFVDGGPSGNKFLMQILADILDRPVSPGVNPELSALGAAYLAGLATGYWENIEALAKLPAHENEITPTIDPASRALAIANWRKAIAQSINGV
jgi:glycerol kinase